MVTFLGLLRVLVQCIDGSDVELDQFFMIYIHADRSDCQILISVQSVPNTGLVFLSERLLEIPYLLDPLVTKTSRQQVERTKQYIYF